MISLENTTRLTAGIYSGYRLDQTLITVCVVKACFQFDKKGNIELVDNAPLHEYDHWVGTPGQSSLLHACEIVPFKQHAELLLNGTAHPQKNTLHHMDVTIKRQHANGLWQKNLRIFGQRYWQRRFYHYRISTPQPVTETPLIYEHAYGGADPKGENKIYPKNPVGKGYLTHKKHSHGQALPLIEAPPPIIRRPRQRVFPAGFSAIPLEWRYDQSKEALASQYNYAPYNQRFPFAFQAGEKIQLQGFWPEVNSITWRIPFIEFCINLISKTKNQPLNLYCDTLQIDTDKKNMSLLWRSIIEKISVDTWVYIHQPNRSS